MQDTGRRLIWLALDAYGRKVESLPSSANNLFLENKKILSWKLACTNHTSTWLQIYFPCSFSMWLTGKSMDTSSAECQLFLDQWDELAYSSFYSSPQALHLWKGGINATSLRLSWSVADTLKWLLNIYSPFLAGELAYLFRAANAQLNTTHSQPPTC